MLFTIHVLCTSSEYFPVEWLCLCVRVVSRRVLGWRPSNAGFLCEFVAADTTRSHSKAKCSSLLHSTVASEMGQTTCRESRQSLQPESGPVHRQAVSCSGECLPHTSVDNETPPSCCGQPGAKARKRAQQKQCKIAYFHAKYYMYM